MSVNQIEQKPKKNISADWLVRGILTKFGDIFDRLTGRKWQPSSDLATSELIEKLKKLLDAEIRETGGKVKFVPHNIKLKMQWDKFSTEGEKSIKALENELLSATVDYINDNHYHTYAPLKLTVKTDYFTDGVKLTAGFDDSEDDGREINVNKTAKTQFDNTAIAAVPVITKTFIAKFSAQEKSVRLNFNGSQRLSVGRTRENSLTIEDASVSKTHASLFVNHEKQLTVADTGSTNGTFINDQRIGYGKAYPLSGADKVKFGTVEIVFQYVPNSVAAETPDDDSYRVGEFEFKTSRQIPVADISAVTEIKTKKTNADEFEMTQPISRDL